jgi:hypothetical protein
VGRDPHVIAQSNSLIQRMFVDTSDQNYVVARWAFLNQFALDFCWLAAHALEKYLKAILLFNDRSARGYSHNIVHLYEQVVSFAPSIDLGELKRPSAVPGFRYREGELARAFVQRMAKLGDPNNRYLTYGYSLWGDEMFKLDQMVWQIRRHCRPLNQTVSDGTREIQIDWAEHLKKSPHQFITSGVIERLMEQDQPSDARAALLEQNLAFNPAPMENVSWYSSVYNPPLYPLFQMLHSENPQNQRIARDTIHWALANMDFSGSDRKKIKAAL